MECKKESPAIGALLMKKKRYPSRANRYFLAFPEEELELEAELDEWLVEEEGEGETEWEEDEEELEACE